MHKFGAMILVGLLSGCAASTNDTQTVGMPNPASAYCLKQGGTLAIENHPKGQVGICTLTNGTKIEEWELYRRDHPQSRT